MGFIASLSKDCCVYNYSDDWLNGVYNTIVSITENIYNVVNNTIYYLGQFYVGSTLLTTALSFAAYNNKTYAPIYYDKFSPSNMRYGNWYHNCVFLKNYYRYLIYLLLN